MALKIWVRMPSTMEAMAMTVETPITTPRMVSAERSLLARMEARAIATPSPKLRKPTIGRMGVRLFGPKRRDGIEPRGASGRINTKEDAGTGAKGERGPDGPERDPGGERTQAGNRARHSPSRNHAHRAAGNGERQCFHQELPPDVLAGGAHRFSNADLIGPLVHGHQHDVHDDDATHDDPNRDDCRDHGKQEARQGLPEGDQAIRLVHREVVRLARTKPSGYTHG